MHSFWLRRGGLMKRLPWSIRSKGPHPLLSQPCSWRLSRLSPPLMRRDSNGVELVARLEKVAFGTGALDLLVTAYRTSPELLAVLLRASRDPERIGRFVRKLGDEDLARAVGHPLILSEDDQRQRLSPRERDVYELLRQGLSNRQIAEALFISEGTAKLHTHHIFNKLGTRSRTALVIQAALEGCESGDFRDWKLGRRSRVIAL